MPLFQKSNSETSDSDPGHFPDKKSSSSPYLPPDCFPQPEAFLPALKYRRTEEYICPDIHCYPMPASSLLPLPHLHWNKSLPVPVFCCSLPQIWMRQQTTLPFPLLFFFSTISSLSFSFVSLFWPPDTRTVPGPPDWLSESAATIQKPH